MILFFGIRPGNTETTKLAFTPCPYCGQTGTLQVSKTQHWFHIFWIKVFKVSALEVAECSHCKRFYYKEEFTKEMQNAIDS